MAVSEEKLVTREEYSKFQQETNDKLKNVETKVDKHSESLDRIESTVDVISGSLESITDSIKLGMEAINKRIDDNNNNFDNQFSMLKDSFSEREKNMTEKVENHITSSTKAINDEMSKHTKLVENMAAQIEQHDLALSTRRSDLIKLWIALGTTIITVITAISNFLSTIIK